MKKKLWRVRGVFSQTDLPAVLVRYQKSYRMNGIEKGLAEWGGGSVRIWYGAFDGDVCRLVE